MRRDVFQAIADPVRREIIQVISGGSHTLNKVAENFNISRPAISKHIKILTECGLVTIRQQGRERYCEARLEKLDEVADWVERYRIFWTAKLDALGDFLDREDREMQAAAPGPVKKISAKKSRPGKKKAAKKHASKTTKRT